MYTLPVTYTCTPGTLPCVGASEVKISMWTIATAAAAVIAAVQTVEEVAPLNALDKYVSTPDPNFHWFDTGARVKPTLSSATAHILNVTSQQWLTEAQAIGPNGALWSKCARGIRT